MPVRTYIGIGMLGIAACLGDPPTAAAQGAAPEPPLFGPAAKKPPLFDPQTLPRDSRDRARQMARLSLEGEKARVVCGMTVIPARPEVDPKSIKKAPDDIKYTMRIVPPSMCGTADSQPAVQDPQPAR